MATDEQVEALARAVAILCEGLDDNRGRQFPLTTEEVAGRRAAEVLRGAGLWPTSGMPDVGGDPAVGQQYERIDLDRSAETDT